MRAFSLVLVVIPIIRQMASGELFNNAATVKPVVAELPSVAEIEAELPNTEVFTDQVTDQVNDQVSSLLALFPSSAALKHMPTVRGRNR